MPHRNWQLYVADMIEAIERIKQYVAGQTLDAFSADQKTVDAVVRNFEILGEAVRHIPEGVKKKHPAIPWAKISSMRNILSHEYFGVDTDILWKTATVDLELLAAKLKILPQ